MTRHRFDPLIVLIALVVAWSIAAAYRIALQVPTPENVYFNYGVMFLIPAFIGLDYLRIRFGIGFSMSVAALAIITSYVVNSDAYWDNYRFAIAASCTSLVAIFVGGLVQKTLGDYPIWEMAVITHVATNIAHSIFFNTLLRFDQSDFYKYVYVSISFKIIMFLFSLPVLLGALKLTFDKLPRNGVELDLNSPTKLL